MEKVTSTGLTAALGGYAGLDVSELDARERPLTQFCTGMSFLSSVVCNKGLVWEERSSVPTDSYLMVTYPTTLSRYHH